MQPLPYLRGYCDFLDVLQEVNNAIITIANKSFFIVVYFGFDYKE